MPALAWGGLYCAVGPVFMVVWVQDLPLSEGTAKFLSGCLNVDGEVGTCWAATHSQHLLSAA